MHRLKALKLNLEYDTEYYLFYCLLNKFKKANQYYNFAFNTYLKENGSSALQNTAWMVAKLHGKILGGLPDFKQGYKTFCHLLEKEIGTRKTTQTVYNGTQKTVNNIYLKIVNMSIDDEKNFTEPSVVDHYVELEKTDVLILKEYLKKKLTKSQYRYIAKYLNGDHSFTVNPIYKRIRHVLKTDDLLKYIKID